MLIEHLVFFEGIENPRVLGSIPSPGTTYFEPSLRRGFLLSESAIFVLSVVNALIVPPAPLPGGATSAL